MAAIADGLLYTADLSGSIDCLDVKTGKVHWKQDTFASIWGSPYVVDGKVLLGTTDGEVVVFQHGSDLKPLAANDMQSTMYTTPVAANGVLYVASCRQLIAIERTDR